MFFGLMALLAVTFLSFLFIKDHALIADEGNTYKAAVTLAESRLDPKVVLSRDTYSFSVLPTYAVLLAVLAGVLGPSAAWMRLCTCLISLLSILAFFWAERRLHHKEDAGIRTWQYAFMPVLYPFFFLIYTEMPSLLFILLALNFALRKNGFWTAVFGLVSVLIRQNNIAWLMFFWAYLYVSENGFSLGFRSLAAFFSRSGVFIAGFMLFGVFVFLNRGVAIGDRSMHPDFSLHTGNIYFVLFTFFVLFLPLNIANLAKVAGVLRKPGVWAALLVFFAVYLATFSNTHPYNQPRLACYLHNKILLYVSGGLWMKTLFFAMAAYAALSISVTRLTEKGHLLIYPAAFFFLLPSWLIEPRYYLIPFTLFLLFREKQKPLVEYFSVGYSICLSLALLQRIQHKLFFL